MKEELQEILDIARETREEEGVTIDEMLAVLTRGNINDIELARYIMEDTTEEGSGYLTDYQCIEIIISTYELKEEKGRV